MRLRKCNLSACHSSLDPIAASLFVLWMSLYSRIEETTYTPNARRSGNNTRASALAGTGNRSAD